MVQSDKTILIEVDNPRYENARDAIISFADLEKSPEYIHTYRITPLSLWNAAASGVTADEVLAALDEYGKYPLPDNVRHDIREQMGRYGKLRLVRDEDRLLLASADPHLITEVFHQKTVRPYLIDQVSPTALAVDPRYRGQIKQALVRLGFPAEDLAGYVSGTALSVSLVGTTRAGLPFALRQYQVKAIEAFHAGGAASGGSGVIVLPCGAGKTAIGIGAMVRLGCQTLILATNVTAVRQWIDELLDKTDLTPELVGEYSGEVKQIRPVTVTTYQILTYRHGKDEDFPHFALFNQGDWGLIIYDEVHLLPAPVFRITAEIQARRRLGLTATLVREDGREEDVFSLIGPKKYDVPWKILESQGWIATADCAEVRIDLPEQIRLEYAVAADREKFRIASVNPAKDDVVKALLRHHSGDRILIIGQYLDQLERLAADLGAELITGRVSNRDRERLYAEFRNGTRSILVVSKVANFSVDLPDANVAIQVSGTFGSRQEEAQRLGRILRPKRDGGSAHFYSLVARETKDADFAANRQRFLTEQGYRYRILSAAEILRLDGRA
ncbi:MAG: DNA repair helicase XPB [Chloroflexota bacterium]